MQRLILFLALLLPLFSCDKEADFRSSELHAPIVGGIQLVDLNRHIGPTIGKPNDKNFDDPQLQLAVYPNPAYDLAHLNLWANRPTQAKVWLVQATMSSSLNTYIQTANATLATIGGEPILKVDNILVNGAIEARIDVSALPEGVYRLYVQMDNQLAWRNIWINRSF